ncbi:MAG: cupredoxin domain-containing protein [Gemmatimonadaceae bacterium]|nr:cupredoxin domain-containing protein [Acetobacteraceae bacterium]
MAFGVCAAWAADTVTVSQSRRVFDPPQIDIVRGTTVRFVNDDGRLLHQVYTSSPTFSFDSGEQKPGATVEARFDKPGTFTVLCGIHPKMRLSVTVR